MLGVLAVVIGLCLSESTSGSIYLRFSLEFAESSVSVLCAGLFVPVGFLVRGAIPGGFARSREDVVRLVRKAAFVVGIGSLTVAVGGLASLSASGVAGAAA